MNVRVVSLPSTDVFDAQEEAYRESVPPSDVSARVAVEAGIADYWYKYVGLKGKIVGMTGYGESAPRISSSLTSALPLSISLPWGRGTEQVTQSVGQASGPASYRTAAAARSVPG